MHILLSIFNKIIQVESEFVLIHLLVYYSNMGLNFSQNIDPDISIYLVTGKRFYFPGQHVEGEIYLIVKSQRMYQKLVLSLCGEERA